MLRWRTLSGSKCWPIFLWFQNRNVTSIVSGGFFFYLTNCVITLQWKTKTYQLVPSFSFINKYIRVSESWNGGQMPLQTLASTLIELTPTCGFPKDPEDCWFSHAPGGFDQGLELNSAGRKVDLVGPIWGFVWKRQQKIEWGRWGPPWVEVKWGPILIIKKSERPLHRFPNRE